MTVNISGTPAAGHAGQIGKAVAAGGTQQVLHSVPSADRARAVTGVHIAFTSAMNEILLVAGVFALVGALLVVFLVRARDFATYGTAETTEHAEPAAAAA